MAVTEARSSSVSAPTIAATTPRCDVSDGGGTSTPTSWRVMRTDTSPVPTRSARPSTARVPVRGSRSASLTDELPQLSARTSRPPTRSGTSAAVRQDPVAHLGHVLQVLDDVGLVLGELLSAVGLEVAGPGRGPAGVVQRVHHEVVAR